VKRNIFQDKLIHRKKNLPHQVGRFFGNFLRINEKDERMNQKEEFLMSFLLVAGGSGGLSDFGHEEVHLGGAPGVDGPALLLACHAANVGGHIVQDGREGDIDHVGLAEGGGNGELILIELVQGLGVEAADEELCAVVDVVPVLLEEDCVEVFAGGVRLPLAADASSCHHLTDNGSLGGSVDESFGDEDLGADDDDGGRHDLGLDVDDGHTTNEGEYHEKGLHFAVIGFLAFADVQRGEVSV